MTNEEKHKIDVIADVTQRRDGDRVALSMPIRLGSIEEALTGDVVNISRSGVFVAMPTRPAVGTRLDLDVVLENGQPLLHAIVEVVRHNTDPVGIGARFIDISYESTSLIERLVKDQRLFGDFRLEALIGRGGMAEVYRAKGLDGLCAGKTVALKRILPELASQQEFTEMFAREAEITRQVRHPGVIEVYDAGKVGDRCYIAMEYVRGIDLRQIIQACAKRSIFIPVDFCAFVVHQVSIALDFVHRTTGADGKVLGLVHRDVSPSNIFISDLGDIKLGDFGIAHLAADPDEDMILGKIPYMAPEQERGEPLGPASDVFALGAVFYELLTNRTAFVGDNTIIVRKRAVRAEFLPLAVVRPDVAPRFQPILERALANKIDLARPGPIERLSRWLRPPKHLRYADAASFAKALEGAYDPSVGTPLGVASVVRGLMRTTAASSKASERDTA